LLVIFTKVPELAGTTKNSHKARIICFAGLLKCINFLVLEVSAMRNKLSFLVILVLVSFASAGWYDSNWASCRELNTSGASNTGNAPYILCAIANSSVQHNLNCTDLRIIKSDNSSAYPSFVQYCHANLSNIYPLADSNSSLICANMTDGALQARLCYRNTGASYISDPTQVYEVYQNSSNGINGAFVNQQAGVMTNTYPYSFLGDTLFYLNDSTSGTYPTSADLGYVLPSDNKTTWGCEVAVIPASNPYYFQFCGASYGSGNVTNGICGNNQVGFYNMLDGQNEYGTGAMSWSIWNGASFYPYSGVTMTQGALTVVQAIFINNRTEIMLVNGTEKGVNQSYSLANITGVGFSVGQYGRGVDKMVLGQLKCGHALNQTQIVSLGVEVNNTAPPVTNVLIANISNPTNTTYWATNMSINISCAGDNESYQLDILVDDNLLVSEAIGNASLFSLSNATFANGGHILNVTCSNGTYTNSTLLAFTTIYYDDHVGLSHTEGTTLDQLAGRWSGGSLGDWATQITITGLNNITRVQLPLQKVDSPSGNLNLRIETNANGIPSGTLVNENAYANITASSVPDSVEYVDFIFPSVFSLGEGTYWIVLDTNEPTGSSIGVFWQSDTESGVCSYNLDRGGWTSYNRTFNYKLCHQLSQDLPNPLTILISNPGNTTYQTTKPDGVRILCNGDNTSYLLNITLDGNLIASQSTEDETTFLLSNATFEYGSHVLTAACENGSYQNTLSVAFTLAPSYDDYNWLQGYDAGTALDLRTGRDSEGNLSELATQIYYAGEYPIRRLQLPLQRIGSPSGNLNLRIETDNEGLPSGTLADENAYVNMTAMELPSSVAYVDFDFFEFEVDAGTYWIVLDTNEPAGSNVGAYWQYDSAGEGTSATNTNQAGWSGMAYPFNYQFYGFAPP
jgi:hypothetical protein